MVMDYGYVNARVRGMHSALLDKKAYDTLLIRQDLPSILSELEKTPYKREIEEASVIHTGIAAIDFALRKNLLRTYQNIYHLVRGTRAEDYIRIFLSRWDVQNIKTILRGKNIHASHDEIFECLVPAGALDDATLTELLKQPDVRSIIDLMATWNIPYALPLTESVDEWAESRELVTLEYALDRFHYQNALAAVQGKGSEERIVRHLIRAEIDTINIKNMLRIIRDSLDAEPAMSLFLEGGGHIDREKFIAMASMRSPQEAVSVLDGTPYYFLQGLPPVAYNPGTISIIEKELDTYLMRKGMRLYRGDPLDIGVVIGYLWAKYGEVINLRIIARCKYAGVSDEDLERELFRV
jgi:V/A-type H+-transporting ATPase subunit C